MTKPTDRVAVTMIGRNWEHLFLMVVEHIDQLIDMREQSYDEEEQVELSQSIRDLIQKMLPVLYLASDKSEDGAELQLLYKDIQKKAGLVVPEHHEDAVKHLVIFVEEEVRAHKKRIGEIWDKINADISASK